MRPWTEPRAPKRAVISKEKWAETKSTRCSWAIFSFPSGTEGQSEGEEHKTILDDYEDFVKHDRELLDKTGFCVLKDAEKLKEHPQQVQIWC